MGNIKQVQIEALWPDYAFEANQASLVEAHRWLGMLSVPNAGGVKATWKKNARIKVERVKNDIDVTKKYHLLTIEGEEAYRWESLVRLTKALLGVCIEVKAVARDIENNTGWYDLVKNEENV